MNKNVLSLFNRFYISLMIMWQPLQMVFFRIDGAGRIPAILTILAFLLNCQYSFFRKIAFSKPACLWLIWVIYAFVNMMVQGPHRESSLPMPLYFMNILFQPYCMMALVCYEGVKNHVALLKLLLWSFVIYAAIGFFVMDVGRLQGAEETVYDMHFTLGNSLALNAVFIVFFAALLWSENLYGKWILIVCMAFALTVVILTATRKAFGAAMIILVFFVLSQIKMSPKNLIVALLAFALLYWGMDYIMDNTLLGERLISVNEIGENYNTTDLKWLSFLGDRAVMYIEGWALFTKKPLFGIGLNNYQYATGSALRLHTEYMVQLAENGLIGALLFVSMYVNIIKKEFKMMKSSWRQVSMISLGGVIAVLFIGLTAWLFQFNQYFVCLGMGLSYYFSKEYENCNC